MVAPAPKASRRLSLSPSAHDRPYIADFACVEARLVIELDGSQHGEASARDARRDAFMDESGWTVLRF
ncbi:MAG: DUF559 domain-containing protein, partial [Pseudomonadota bacterium]